MMIAHVLIRLRDISWRARRGISNDRFEKSRGEDYCGVVSLVDEGLAFEKYIEKLSSFEYRGKLPERDCLLQFEESGQLASLHWMLDDKYQLHTRYFIDNRGDHNRARQYVIVHAHMEIRPDYNPLAHVLGVDFKPACMLYHKIIQPKTLYSKTVL